ncbi:alpha/beta fold hydrolase [Curtobacterium sp. MCPF17_002]|uniref:alpha/beta fold hydrolase n=1 Tax=Curtobacterium sp. MCPF17_002 TaxID=2175645 RepID=UPI000DA9DF7E|nr:alpha/beta fold hydrolase [Curtobacterium sp. MCPF17_002]WIB78737.1 alpha/beta fold hydrolase [Curtobacterium sp. MCPF17_002]
MQSERHPAGAGASASASASPGAGPGARVEVAVRGHGAPVLVVHGTPGGIDGAEIMARFLPSDGFRVVTVSRPGYLGTPLDPDRSSLDDEADRFAAVLDDLGIDRAAVLAWSGGGPAAYRFAVRHPDRIRSLVVAAGLSGPWVPPHPGPLEWIVTHTVAGAALARAAARLAPAAVVRFAEAGVSSLRGAALREHVRGVLADPLRRAFVLDLATTGNTSGRHRPGWDNDVRNLGAALDLGLRDVRTPTLLVHGAADTDVDPSHSARAAAEVPGAELVTLPGGTHFALWAHRDAAAVQERVRAHLRSGQA